MMAEAAIVAGKVDGGACLTEVVNAGGQVGAADAIVKGDTLDTAARRLAVATRAEQFTDMREKGRLADAAGDEANVSGGRRFGKTIAQGAPDFERITNSQAGKSAVILPTTK